MKLLGQALNNIGNHKKGMYHQTYEGLFSCVSCFVKDPVMNLKQIE
jgi:hypothetical protein